MERGLAGMLLEELGRRDSGASEAILAWLVGGVPPMRVRFDIAWCDEADEG